MLFKNIHNKLLFNYFIGLKNLKVVILFISSILFVHCNSVSSEHEVNNNNTDNQNSSSISVGLELANKKDKIHLGDSVTLLLNFPDSIPLDSVVFTVGENFTQKFLSKPNSIKFSTQGLQMGSIVAKSIIYVQSKTHQSQISIRILPNTKPLIYGYKVVKSFPHDKGAFTQGFVFDNGYFYEATGLKGESSLRKVKPENGEVLKSFAVSSEIFGEGIAIFDNKIAQLSWQDRVGFVYEKETFRLLKKFEYNTEGWGLTYNGENLIMSDGTHHLYFLDTQMYTVIKTLEIVDFDGQVSMLNELEYINGEVYANVYMTDRIARIDPQTGVVKAYIDLKGILPDNERTRDTDVLNGIAYDAKQNRLFVTGKKWPKIYEIELVQK